MQEICVSANEDHAACSSTKKPERLGRTCQSSKPSVQKKIREKGNLHSHLR